MRIPDLVILAVASVSVAVPARAQTYDPGYPVCLEVYSIGGGHIDCSYGSMAQCAASSRGGQCSINPYFAGGQNRPASKRTR